MPIYLFIYLCFLLSDFEAICRLCDGFNGADLRNVCTEAGRWCITYDGFIIQEYIYLYIYLY